MDILAKNLLILASAGSGKTFQLAHRIIGLVANGADPERIVALTFTRKAAGEFADSVLTQLAKAASSESAANTLRLDLSLHDADFSHTLERVVQALPRLSLGTIDGFFSKIIQCFQYEMGLTGGKFDLLEGPRAQALTDQILTEILGDSLTENDEFFHAFRRATIGREDQQVLPALRNFINLWHHHFRETRNLEWGPATLSPVDPLTWTQQKSDLTKKIIQGLDAVTFSRKGQRQALEKEISNLENHSIGSGSINSNTSSLLNSIFDAVATQSGNALSVKFYKEFSIDGPAADALRSLVILAAQCELSTALLRTRSLHQLISIYDKLCAKRLRNIGLLGFNDVKILMGQWAHNENARLRRERIDFRLDARIDHWLLDEFQDTSRADWMGLLPLIDEAATDSDRTVFIVGDRKQAIYSWRGGDVTLFDDVLTRYHGGIETAPMDESWRSCPEVLALVNQVCGDSTTLHELFPETANRWEWHHHRSAQPLTLPSQRGEARVEFAGDWNQRLIRLGEILRELGVGDRSMTCAVLLRNNLKAREVTDSLRSLGFDVIEEGRREPAKDNPVGIVISNLLEWLANPANSFAREVLEMSPLAAELHHAYGPSWRAIWENLTDKASKTGYAGLIGDVIAQAWPNWSDFGQRRAADLIDALATLDAQGCVSPSEAAHWIDRLEISQNPGVASIQVMTFHKAKGLGFDLVILPEIPDSPSPQTQYFDVAIGDKWLTQTPPKWARSILPNLRDAENHWAANQQYESFCMLYVALTRARRGLVVLLQAPTTTANPDKPSLANWLTRSLHPENLTGVIYQNGSPDWVLSVPLLEPEPKPNADISPGQATPRRIPATPSKIKHKHHAPRPSPTGMQFGTEVHSLLERVTWIDEELPILPTNEAGNAVAALLKNPALLHLFERQNRSITLFREQCVDAVINDQFLAGVIDRLLIHRSPDNSVTRVEIIDFKTDTVNDPAELIDRYATQMAAYQSTLKKIHPSAEINSSLLSVHLGVLVPVDA